MREIKFRGKRTDNGLWAYGYYLPWHSVKTLDGKDVLAQIFEEIDEKHPKGWAMVYNDTLSQYTGLTDKNGKEIYEGDIVRTKYKEFRDFGDEKSDYFTSLVEEVVWLPVLNGFGLVYHIEDIPVYRPLNYTTEIRGVKLIEVEVIGNIYDNSELLVVEE